jgi:hypothetical protein
MNIKGKDFLQPQSDICNQIYLFIQAAPFWSDMREIGWNRADAG